MGFSDICYITAVQGCCSETWGSFTRGLPMTWRWMRGVILGAEKSPEFVG